VKRFLPLFAAAFALAACATPPEPRPVAAAKVEDTTPACKATPKELVIKDLQEGTGRELIPRASVLVQYTGWLYDGCKADLKGKQFDSSRDRPVPFGFMVGAGRVIKGWDEGVIGMKEKGARRLLIIPPDKAYGEKGVGDRIPPNAALVFEIETVQIAYYPGAAGPATK
jgi:FKBP-type peptidyl-prolyl cis-trans isomerase